MNDNELIGTGWLFPPQFRSPATGPEMVTNQQLIEQAITQLLNTRIGERMFEPDFGSGLYEFLFHTPDAEALADIKEEIAKAIAQHEGRITLQEINFDSRDIYDGLLNIELAYLINQTNSPANMVFPFYLGEG
ncbi:GPW/gp25 family protein [uncultured Shewanella sp.]|uniref:GPW/gp25 family protein n=1 Tax=uncultured Shewanella sp. TaxID=173975 RepID=UPI002603B5C9|nr:GPW/gp25 family protein [uncultured Shewanella sp.]